MTSSPYVLETTEPLAAAHEMMQKHLLRHLPIIDGDTVVGIVSERDLYLMETLKGVDPAKVPVAEVMTALPYRVTPDTPLAEVARTMARNRYGAVLVMENDRLLGILTTVDMLDAMANELDHATKPKEK